MKLLYLLSFVGLALANVEMFDQPPEGHCNAIYHCPLKKEYRDAGMKLSEEDDKKLYSKYKECCSFYGHCGTTDEYCQIGCQSGDCDQKFVQVTQRLITCSTYSLLGKCDEYCTCPEGQCCSKYGYCGKGEKYCGTSEPDKTTDKEAKETPKVKGRCGSGYGNCPDGLCCSKYGWCGTTSEYCDSGCQEKYGKCGKESDTHGKYGKCGKNYGKCPKDLCCSEYGYCGSTSAYCSKKQGCQSEFGRCD